MAVAAPHRSVLYMPASNLRALEKGRTLPVDALILDLEDAVAPDQKALARTQAVAVLAEGGFAPRRVALRINGPETPWGAEDLEAALTAAPDAILLPKVETAETVVRVAARCDAAKTRVWAMMETARGLLAAREIAAAPGLEAMVMGTNDLARELQCRDRSDRRPLLTGLQLCLLAARMAGLIALDGVYNAFRDAEGFRRECEDGRDLGFDGKTLIHPGQIEIANTVFAPDIEELAAARDTVRAFREAKAAGAGVAVLNGRIVENLHVEIAERTLARAAAISAREQAA
ncbi:MAG: CoA ester lyase [Pseudomonadota bacterium]